MRPDGIYAYNDAELYALVAGSDVTGDVAFDMEQARRAAWNHVIDWYHGVDDRVDCWGEPGYSVRCPK